MSLDSRSSIRIAQASLPLFYQDWWLDAVYGAGQWRALRYTDDAGNTYGYWPIGSTKVFGATIIQQPALTPYNGPLLYYPDNLTKLERRYSHEHRVLSSLLQQLPSASAYRFRLMPNVENWLAFYNAGYRQTTQFTYQLSGIRDLSTIRKGYKSQVRNHIRAAAEQFSLEQTTDPEALLPLLEATHNRKGKDVPAICKKLINATIQQQQGECWITRDKKTGTSVAGSMIVWDQMTAYLLLLGVDKTKASRGAVQLLIDHLIARASRVVDRFDFEGSMIPEVEPVFRAFGGQRLPYSIMSKASKWFDSSFFLARSKPW